MGISIPYFFVLPAVCCLVALMILFYNKNHLFIQNRRTFFYCFLAPCLIIYGLFMIWVIYEDMDAAIHLNSFDLDQDGFFGIDEQSPEQQVAFDKVIHDTGRNFAVFTTAIFSMIVGMVFYLTVKLGFALKKN